MQVIYKCHEKTKFGNQAFHIISSPKKTLPHLSPQLLQERHRWTSRIPRKKTKLNPPYLQIPETMKNKFSSAILSHYFLVVKDHLLLTFSFGLLKIENLDFLDWDSKPDGLENRSGKAKNSQNKSQYRDFTRRFLVKRKPFSGKSRFLTIFDWESRNFLKRKCLMPLSNSRTEQ